MEAHQTATHTVLTDVFKSAVNTFHRSIMRHGPYDTAPCCNPRWPMKVMCVWPEGETWKHERKCLYVCDTEALKRIETAMNKVQIFDQGVTWPHVNHATEPPMVEWLLFRDDSTVSNSPKIPFPKRWFVVSEDSQDILDYVIHLHNLLPAKVTSSMALDTGVKSTDVSLTSIIMHPGDIITSFFQSPNPDVGIYILSSQSSVVHTECVADKNGVKCCISHSIDKSHSVLMDCKLKYHTVFNELPLHLKSFITCLHKRRFAVCTDNAVVLKSEITIKEEQLDQLVEGATATVGAGAQQNSTASVPTPELAGDALFATGNTDLENLEEGEYNSEVVGIVPCEGATHGATATTEAAPESTSIMIHDGVSIDRRAYDVPQFKEFLKSRKVNNYGMKGDAGVAMWSNEVLEGLSVAGHMANANKKRRRDSGVQESDALPALSPHKIDAVQHTSDEIDTANDGEVDGKVTSHISTKVIPTNKEGEGEPKKLSKRKLVNQAHKENAAQLFAPDPVMHTSPKKKSDVLQRQVEELKEAMKSKELDEAHKENRYLKEQNQILNDTVKLLERTIVILDKKLEAQKEKKLSQPEESNFENITVLDVNECNSDMICSSDITEATVGMNAGLTVVSPIPSDARLNMCDVEQNDENRGQEIPQDRVVTDEKFHHIMKKCRLGAAGDSVFVRELAEVLWDRNVLAQRSVTGMAAVNKYGAQAYKECTPHKKKTIEDLMARRLDSEGVTDDKERIKRIRSYKKNLNGKIKSIRPYVSSSQQPRISQLPIINY